ncbi:mfs multidrug transporter [Fusarium sp. NRRL 52700]|nr:mfs multidrug transporter [Fusarium sp. NRRL 52700]
MNRSSPIYHPLKPSFDNYNELVQHLVLSQLCNPTSSARYQNLFNKFPSFVVAQDQLHLVIYALGGTNIPAVLFKSIRLPQRRWNDEGEVDQTSAAQSGLPKTLVHLVCDEAKLSEAIACPYGVEQVQEDNTIAWSLSAERMSTLQETLTPQTIEVLEAAAMKLICFVCPLCYEGNTDWTHVIEAALYLCERDSLAIRRATVKQAKLLLRKSMPYYLHASVVLFGTILHRVDGGIARSEAQIRDFLWRVPRPSTRRGHALEDRLHISQMENKIKCYDNVVPSFAYKWEAAIVNLGYGSDLDAVTASLERFLSLGRMRPIPKSSRRVLLARLSDEYCEMGKYIKAMEILEPELEHVNPGDRIHLGSRRLILAVVEANIGLKQLAAAESALEELPSDLPLCPGDINDQQLHMTLLASARIAHMKLETVKATRRWIFALEKISQMHAVGSSRGFTAAVCHLSLAHVQLSIGEKGEAHRSWTTGLNIMACEKCEFWIPVVPTAWLHRIAVDIYHSQG